MFNLSFFPVPAVKTDSTKEFRCRSFGLFCFQAFQPGQCCPLFVPFHSFPFALMATHHTHIQTHTDTHGQLHAWLEWVRRSSLTTLARTMKQQEQKNRRRERGKQARCLLAWGASSFQGRFVWLSGYLSVSQSVNQLLEPSSLCYSLPPFSHALSQPSLSKTRTRPSLPPLQIDPPPKTDEPTDTGQLHHCTTLHCTAPYRTTLHCTAPHAATAQPNRDSNPHLFCPSKPAHQQANQPTRSAKKLRLHPSSSTPTFTSPPQLLFDSTSNINIKPSNHQHAPAVLFRPTIHHSPSSITHNQYKHGRRQGKVCGRKELWREDVGRC